MPAAPALVLRAAYPVNPRMRVPMRHETTNEAPWIEERNTLTEALTRKPACFVKAGGGSVEGGTKFYGEVAVQLRPSRRNNKEYSWTALISKYTKCGQGRQALRTYEEMLEDGVQPSSYTFVAILKACSTLSDLESTRRIHAEVVRRGFASDLHVCTMLVNVYSTCRSLEDARLAFDMLPYRDVVSWNAMIFGYAQMGEGEEALQLYTRMQQEGVPPDERTFVSILKACSSVAGFEERSGTKERCLETVRAIHRNITKWKFESSLFLGNMLVDVYAKCGSLAEARNVFEKIRQRDVVSWNAMLLGYAQMDNGEEALQLYSRMEHEGVAPDARTYVGLLKACSSLAGHEDVSGADAVPAKNRSLKMVRAIHARVIAGQFELDVFVGTMLVDAYAKCGSLEGARQVFENMPRRNVVSWNAIILGCSQMGESEEALQLYLRMQKEGIIPDDRTYVSALKACSGMADLEGGIEDDGKLVKQKCLQAVRSIHTDVAKRKFESDVFVGTMLVDVYAKCGSLEDATGVFEGMPRRTVVTWNAIISGYAQMGEGCKALHLYARMQQEGVVPNDRTYVSALRACSSLKDLKDRSAVGCTTVEERCLKTVRGIHADATKGKFEKDLCVGTVLVESYAKYGSLEDAIRVFETMPHHDSVSWTAIILGYANRNLGNEALQQFARMQLEGVTPSDRTYVSVLKACSSLVDFPERHEGVQEICLETVRAIHVQIVSRKFESDVFVGTMLVDVYAKCGSLEDAVCVFEKMPHRDVVSWTAMILCYAQMDKGEQALQLFAQMQMDGVVPNDRTYVGALKACSSLAESRHESDAITIKCLNTVRFIHTEVVKRRFESDVFVGNMLVDAYAKCQSLEDARTVFEKMPHRDVVSWNAMILGYAQLDKGELALQLYNRMQQEGVLPNDRTYVSALKACGCQAGLEKGKEIHAQILDSGLDNMNSFVASALIDMYGKCGSMSHAQQVFNTLHSRDIVAWSALIAGYANQGESELVFELLQRMKHDGVQPNSVTFLSVLTVCSHVGQLERGQKYFEAMSRDYAISPTIKHVTCLVDLLGRSGQLEKAMEMVKALPFKADGAVWECLLAACRKWSNVELGRQAFQSAVRLDENNAAAYVLMSHIFTASHMHEEAKEIHAMRVKSRAWKQPGQSQCTDMSGIMHVFVVGDREHFQIHDIYAKLGDLEEKMRNEGYSLDLDSGLLDMLEDDNDSLCGRSEILAMTDALSEVPRAGWSLVSG